MAFLFVLLASAISRSGRDSSTLNGAQQAAVNNEPSEPLADLGVAPGSGESANNSATK